MAATCDRLVHVGGGTVVRLHQVEFFEHGLELFPVFGPVDAVGVGSHDVNPGVQQRGRQVERGLAAELDDDAGGPFGFDDVKHIFARQRLEIKLVRGVIIRADGLGVAVDHDAFNPFLPQRKRGVDTAVIKLDALADAVGPAPQNHDLGAVGLARFVFLFVGGVIIRCGGFEFRRTGIHQFIHRH